MYVYAFVYVVCTNVDFMHLTRYCSGYVTLGINGDDFFGFLVMIFLVYTLKLTLLNFTRNLPFPSLVLVSEWKEV